MSLNNELLVAVKRTDEQGIHYFRQIDYFNDIPLSFCPQLYFELINWTMYCMLGSGKR